MLYLNIDTINVENGLQLVLGDVQNRLLNKRTADSSDRQLVSVSQSLVFMCMCAINRII
jgi:hypothetical protein